MRIPTLVFVLFATGSIAAASPAKLDYLVELGNGVAIPLGGDSYKQLVDPSYKASLRFALGIPVVKELRLGPVVQLDGTAINSNDSTFGPLRLDARFGRLRFLVGADARYRVIPRVDLWLRFTVGLDYVKGSVAATLLGCLSQDYSSTVFGFEPAVGVTVSIWRMLTAGLGIGFPIALNHKFGGAAGSSFNAADLDLTLLVGARF